MSNSNNPKINLALVGSMPDVPVEGTVYLSPDSSGNFIKVGVAGGSKTIFDGSEYAKESVSVTYSELVTLKDESRLSSGARYRITDYACTTTQSNTISAGHAFDIIVTAFDKSTLGEEAKAVRHDGDTYFNGSKLESWQLKYCLDNDSSRFAWADRSNGKGVIYYMKDEFGNECPYDFKNIQFKIGVKSNAGTKANVYYYTFSVATGTNDAAVTDHSLNGAYCYGNSFKKYIDSNNKQGLNLIVCRNTSITSNCYGNSTGENCYDIACGDYCYIWSCGNNCSSWSCGNYCFDWSCGNNCMTWSCGNWCDNWSCGNGCVGWLCGNYCKDWSCGNVCGNWRFGNSSASKNYYRYIMIDDGCSYFYLDTIQTTSSSKYVQNIHICQGISGTASVKKTITISTVNNDYTIRVENDSDGNMLIYNLPDEIQGTVKYDSSQSLTSAQKSQACSNIGAVSMDNFVTDGLYMRKNSAWTAVAKADLLDILGGEVETWTFTDENNVQYVKNVIVLN